MTESVEAWRGRRPLPHGLVSFPRNVLPWIEPWFLTYACLGVVQGGMLPILLPLSAGGSTHAGAVVGVMNLAGLTAPAWGHLADRRRLHREVLLIGLVATVAPLALMPAELGLPVKLALAAALGAGFAAANTVANMFIVEVRPKEEWDARIGALQALSGVGQVAGLLLAGIVGGRYALAYGVSAALVLAAAPIAWLTLRRVHIPVPRSAVTARAPLGGEAWAGAPQRQFHLPTPRGLAILLRELETPFARLLTVWFVAFAAIGAVLTMFPLAVIEAFHVSARPTAATYAFAAAASLGCYPLAASVAAQHGPLLVLRVGFAARTLAVAIVAAAFVEGAGGLPVALFGFAVLTLAWPLLGVAGTALTAELAPGEKGEALGLFNAASSFAGAVGAFLGGWGMAEVGYGALCWAAALVVAVAALGSVGVKGRSEASANDAGA
ncbi:MAG: MFS transporter [Hyphomicrobiales bacterium]|nr:MFS transporter [Hyphomicrobiales bacterium]